MVTLFVFFLNYKESIRAPIALASLINLSDCKLCFIHKMSSQAMKPRSKFILLVHKIHESLACVLLGHFVYQAFM